MPVTQMETEAKKAFDPLISFRKAVSNSLGWMDYWSEIQRWGVSDPSYYYQKAVIIPDIPSVQLSGVLQKLCACAEKCPVVNTESGIIAQYLGGELDPS